MRRALAGEPWELIATAPLAWQGDLLVAWRPLPRLGGNAWAEQVRELSKDESPKPGRWVSVPWQREILDALADPVLQWIVIKKATQMGVSELVRCAIGRWALHDPGDVLWVMTTEAFAKRAMKKLQGMFKATPELRKLLSPRRKDSTLLELVLTNGMRIVIGWAGSAQSLSSDAFRRVVLDEVAKYQWTVQGEGSPVDLARARTKVWGRRGLVVLLSSPKHEDDPICTEYRKVLDKRTLRVPCPSCHHLQPADWGRVRWPGGTPAAAPTDPDARVLLADELERAQTAWLECVTPSCEGRIQPGVAQADPRTAWVPEREVVPGSRQRAYHVPEFWHWAQSLTDMLVKWLRAIHPFSLKEFNNGSLGVADRDEQSPIEAATIQARAIWPAKLVPSFAVAVLATADTQLRGWWLQVRAWGKGARSRLLDWGWVETEEELLDRILHARFPVEGGGEAPITAAAIDTGGGMETPDGSRTDQVYGLLRRHRTRLHGIKGDGSKGSADGPWRRSKLAARAKSDELEICLVNRAYYADMAATLVRSRPVLWEECQGAEHRDYAGQMASEKKVLVTSASGSEWQWVKRSQGVANHQWDLARYQCWLAEYMKVEKRPRPVWEQTARSAAVGPARDREREDRWVIGRGD